MDIFTLITGSDHSIHKIRTVWIVVCVLSPCGVKYNELLTDFQKFSKNPLLNFSFLEKGNR